TSFFLFIGLLLASPFWGSAGLLATCMMNDSDHYNQRFQFVSFLSLVSTPVSLVYTLYHNNYYGYNKKITMYPIISVLSYISFSTLFFHDKK
ncbi:hypothetical protein DICPUDRAFT_13832, partial [Dictyostelium purpureum]